MSLFFQKAKILLHTLFTNLSNKQEIVFISESVNWVISDIGREVVAAFNAAAGKKVACLSYSPFLLRNKVLHFGSVGTLIKNGRIISIHPSNRIILTWYHIVDNDPRVSLIPELSKRVDLIHTACTITKEKLIACGCDPKKIIVIPEHIDLSLFVRYPDEKKKQTKERLGLPFDRVIIGSFQKDGAGWGEGNEPKLEKGPDIFCDAVEQLAKEFPIHVLLTGPARGYVKHRLAATGIPFTHQHLKDLKEIVSYYNALDLYLVTSREEGGPRAILESWACGVPLISTRVGMAPDIMKDGENGFLVEVEDRDAVVARAQQLISDYDLQKAFIEAGIREVKRFSFDRIIPLYASALYGIPLLAAHDL